MENMGIKWTAFAAGLILIVSPWVLGFSDISLAKWCNVSVGIVLAVVGAWMIFERRAVPAVQEAAEPQRQPKRRSRQSLQPANVEKIN
jgi:SPW repeat